MLFIRSKYVIATTLHLSVGMRGLSPLQGALCCITLVKMVLPSNNLSFCLKMFCGALPYLRWFNCLVLCINCLSENGQLTINLMVNLITNMQNNASIFRANLQRTGFYSGKDPEIFTQIKWQKELDQPPIFYQNIIYGTRRNNLAAINLETGESIWNFTTEFNLCTVPAVHNNIVYVSEEIPETCRVYALDYLSGNVLWQQDVNYFINDDDGEIEVCSHSDVYELFVVDEQLYLISAVGKICSMELKSKIIPQRASYTCCLYADVLFAKGVLYCASAQGHYYKGIVAIAPQFNLNQTANEPIPITPQATTLWHCQNFESPPVSCIIVEGKIYLLDSSYNFYIIDSITGKIIHKMMSELEENEDNSRLTMAYYEGVCYWGKNEKDVSYIYAMNVDKQNIIWSVKMPDFNIRGVSLAENLVYIYGSHGIWIVDMKKGKILQKFDIFKGVNCVVIHQGMAYCTTYTGYLIALE